MLENVAFENYQVLNNTPSKTKHLHKRLRALSLQERKMEMLFYQVFPLFFSLMVRLYVLFLLSGVHYGLLSFITFSPLVIFLLSYKGKEASLQYESALKIWYQDQYDILYQAMHYKTRHQASYPGRAILQKEKIKACVGLWVFIVMVINIVSVNKSNVSSCLLIITWLGVADLVWAIWHAYVEWLGLSYEESTKQEYSLEPIYRVDLQNLELFPDHKPINISVTLGDTLWVCGKNGSGKTSLLKAMLGGGYESGNILYNGNKILPKDVCVLSSDMVLRLGVLRDYLSISDVILFKLDKAISKLPKKMDTPISDLHHKWSKGMLQKLNLGWALSSNVSLFLLDEACCHLPLEEEIAFYKMLQNKKRIIILVSHQLSNKGFESNNLQKLHLI